MDFEKITSCILDVFKTCNVRSFPIDCFYILSQYGYRVKKYSELSPTKRNACLRLSRDACTIEDTIYYEDRNIEERIRFSVMHEFGHILLLTDDEDMVDLFASHILAPRIMIHKTGCRTSQAIHDAFGLSYAASGRALADYYNWFQRICHTTRKPSLPEQKIEQLFVSKDAQASEGKPVAGNVKRIRKGKNKTSQKSEERAAFLQEVCLIQDETCIFHLAEKQRLYGKDL